MLRDVPESLSGRFLFFVDRGTGFGVFDISKRRVVTILWLSPYLHVASGFLVLL